MRGKECCALFEAKGRGEREDVVRRHDGLFRESAGAHTDHHFVALRKGTNVGRNLVDEAGRFHTRYKRQIGLVLIEALNHQPIREIDARRLHIYAHGTGREFGSWQVRYRKALGRTEFAA
jgi:hypothetical protein